MNKLQLNYEVFMINQSEKADIIYQDTIAEEKVIDILSQAKSTKSLQKKDELREELLNLLKQRYKTYKKQGLLQYHFILPDNRTFLRLHKPDKFGDDLSDIRLDVSKVNETKQIVRGFSQGRTAHAFRNVYPIFDKQNNYIAALEISYPSEVLQKKLNDISEIQSEFLVNKKIFNTKMWKREDRVLNYKPSYVHKDYLLTVYHLANERNEIKDIKQRVQNLKEEIYSNFEDNLMFSLVSKGENSEYKVISFYPIYQNISNEVSAWLVAYNHAPSIAPAIKDSLYIRVFSFVFFALLLYFIYTIVKQKTKLAKIVKSYDDNVIFSTTNLRGVITHASKAFCKISGYKEEELIGKPHNIVRHKDMPKEAFKQMWETIKAGKIWRGEVKNRKKDGSHYWVRAEVEPIFNESNKIIGYSAVRSDITNSKEIEEIQKEIIFTMGSIGERRSNETGNHVKRVAEYSALLAKLYGLKSDECELLRMASPMHDIGKVGIPDSILNKPGRLTQEEREVMNSHVELGYDMLKNSDRPLLKVASIVAYEHHERWDGKGFPRKLKEEEIHIYGRITALADVFDALGSNRCYKKAWDDEKIFELFKEESGKQFDPNLVKLFFDNLDKFLKIRDNFKDEIEV